MKKFVFVILFCCSWLSLKANEGSVVFIHGFMTSYRSMIPIQKVFNNTCLDLYLWNYPSRRHTIEENAASLVCLLQEIACNQPGKPINFVAHSIGGIVLRAALNLPGCPQEARIGRAVLLSPPNKGASLARTYRCFFPICFLLGNKTGCELMNYTERDIINLGNFPDTMDILIVAGCKKSRLFWMNKPNDGFLLVSETIPNTPYYFRSYKVTHGKMLRYRYIHCLARQFICKEPICQQCYEKGESFSMK